MMNPTNNINAAPSNRLFNIGESILESKRQIQSILIRHKAFYEPCTMDDIRSFTENLKKGYDEVFDEFIAETLLQKSKNYVANDETDSNDNCIIVSDEETQNSPVSKDEFGVYRPNTSDTHGKPSQYRSKVQSGVSIFKETLSHQKRFHVVISDSESENEIKSAAPKPVPAVKSKFRLISDVISDEENISMDELFTEKSNRTGLDKIVKPSQMSGCESSLIEQEQQKAYDPDRVFSDSEDEFEYQEKRCQNEEYLDEIEGEFIVTEYGNEVLLGQLPISSGNSTNSELIPLPDNRSYTAIDLSNKLIEVSDTNDDNSCENFSATSHLSKESQASHLRQIQLEHCYCLPPTAPMQSSSTTSYAKVSNFDKSKPSTYNVFIPDVTTTTPSSIHVSSKPATKGEGNTRKDPNPYRTKSVDSTTEDDELLSMVSLRKRNEEKYQERTSRDQAFLLYDFLTNGIDVEDIAYIKRSYEILVEDDQNNDWLNATHFMDHSVTNCTLFPSALENRKKEDNLKRHITGSARTEGYYKVDHRDKIRFKYHHTKSLNDINTCDDVKNKMISKMRESRVARLNQRRMSIEFGAGAESELLRFKRLKFAKSSNNDWGVFAMEPIAANEMVIEYVGEAIRPVVADLRETKYKASGIVGTHMFGLDSNTIIDATKCGNLARFINHSCNPNCYAKVITIESEKKIVIYSKQPIGVNEEITYDHQISDFENHFRKNQRQRRKNKIRTRQFKCGRCKKRFNLRIGLKRHRREVHFSRID